MTTTLTGQPGWMLMTAIHGALRRDLDQLIDTTASRDTARARWAVFRDHLSYHLMAEGSVMWPAASARLAGEDADPGGRALLDAMLDERQLIGPLLSVADDAFAMDANPGWLRQVLTRLQTRLASHLAHEEAQALPLLSEIMTAPELGRITRAIRGGTSAPHATRMVAWALAGASPDVRCRVLADLPVPARLLHRATGRPRYARPERGLSNSR
jgi:Hemerythrin HHE cation binding domain